MPPQLTQPTPKPPKPPNPIDQHELSSVPTWITGHGRTHAGVGGRECPEETGANLMAMPLLRGEHADPD